MLLLTLDLLFLSLLFPFRAQCHNWLVIPEPQAIGALYGNYGQTNNCPADDVTPTANNTYERGERVPTTWVYK